jgi:hypothetical protein
MPFERYLCWDPMWAERVMNTEALQPPPHVFLAVHHPVKMFQTTLTALYKGQPSGREVSRYTEEQFLKELLKPKDFAFVPVLGNAGTGKSHLVRWIKENIPAAPNRHVLLIPKVDTNLKDVLARILNLPGVKDDPQFDDYRSRLRRAASELRTDKEAREKLLNNLAVACGENGPHKMQRLNEYQDEIAKKLPDLLYDPFFRDEFLKDGGVIHRLVRHTIGESHAVERLEEKRGFTEADLPLQVSAIKKASEKARGFYQLLLGDSTRRLHTEVVGWLNDHRDTAITELLQFRGDELFRLMLEVREALAAQETELILLIEDFAKLQGIDMQLLEAIIARPMQDGRKPLCTMRTVLACTKGYFGTLFDTVQTRVDFCVTLDPPTGTTESEMAEGELDQFLTRYLNAVRAPEPELEKWLESAGSENMDGPVPPPNRCKGCSHRARCHDSFGESGGVGLYPFTSISARRMTERASPGGFNPRFVIKDVLKAVMATYAKEISVGQFPPPALLDHLGGSQLPATVSNDLKQFDSNPATRERRRVLIDLWSDGTKFTDLDPGIHEAFALPALKPTVSQPKAKNAATKTDVTVKDKSRPEPSPRPAANELPEMVTTQLKKLDDWQNYSKNGWPKNFGKLDQGLVQSLRTVVFDAVKGRINWDGELLVEGFFAGDTGNKPFKRLSVNFEGQSVQKSIAQVKLSIPTSQSSFTDAALALQALILFKHHGSWRFTYNGRHGSYFLRRYAQQLETWVETVLAQIRRPTNNGEAWNPVPAAAELLALAARMASRPVASKTAAEDHLSAALSAIESTSFDARSSNWKQLFATLQINHDALKEIVLSHAGCTKGGSRKIQVIDVSQLLEPLRAVRKDWKPKESIPADVWDTYVPIRKVREKVDTLLSTALTEERTRHLGWLDQLRNEVAPETDRGTVVETVKAAVEAAQAEGVFAGVARERIESALDAFGRIRLDEYLRSIDRLRNPLDAEQLLLELGRDLSEPMAKVDEFVSATRQFIDASSKRVESEIKGLDGTGEYKAAETAISKNMSDLDTLLSVLSGGGS